MNKHIEMPGTVKSRHEFISFMQLYISTVEDSSVKDYLNSVVSRVEDIGGFYNNTCKETLQNINCHLVTTLFYVGSIYE